MFSAMLVLHYLLAAYLLVGAVLTAIRSRSGVHVPVGALVLWAFAWPAGLVLMWLSRHQE
jgi:hypothetical protein